MIYVIVFLISTLFMYLFEKSNKKNKYIYAIFAIIIPSILAGIRDIEIGTDVKVYILKNFNLATNYISLTKYLNNFGDSYGYWIIGFLVSRFTKNISVLLFIYQLIIMLFVFLICKDNKERCPAYLSYFTFLTLFYNRSLNMSRQTIAIVIIIYALKYIENGKNIKYIIWIIISSLFHFTALSAIFIFIIIKTVKYDKGKIVKFLILTGTFMCLVFFDEITSFLINDIHVLPLKYLAYTVHNGYIKVYELAMKVFFILILGIYAKILFKKDKFNSFLFFCLILDLIIYFIGIISKYANRIGYYFGYLSIIVYPQIYKIFKNKEQRICAILAYIILMLLYWYIYYAYFKNDQTVPYLINSTIL